MVRMMADTLSACLGSIIVAISHTHRKLVWEGVHQVARWVRVEGLLGLGHCKDKHDTLNSLATRKIAQASCRCCHKAPPIQCSTPKLTICSLLHNICRISRRASTVYHATVTSGG